MITIKIIRMIMIDSCSTYDTLYDVRNIVLYDEELTVDNVEKSAIRLMFVSEPYCRALLLY